MKSLLELRYVSPRYDKHQKFHHKTNFERKILAADFFLPLIILNFVLLSIKIEISMVSTLPPIPIHIFVNMLTSPNFFIIF